MLNKTLIIPNKSFNMKRFSFFCLLSVCVFYNMHGMQINDLSTEIEFHGEKKSIIKWIIVSCFNNSKFSVTHNIEYKDGEFTKNGDLRSLSPEDINEIGKGNAVYCPFYTQEKTKFSKESYGKVGAIIIGTKDIEKCDDLCHAALDTKMQQNK